jgi:para-nitrobenzyl esterase
MEYIVKTPCGEVKGCRTQTEGVIAYKGIRYATAARFEYPVEVTSWEGVYDATEYGACAYQPRSFYDEEKNVKKYFYYNEFRKGETYKYSEDCLFLNVFTPEQPQEQKLPVLVYIHGGGFTGGCGHEKHFDVPVWPTKGVIGVTLNYRLGPLGFATLPELKEEAGKTGNYGLYDQLAAISWVRHNIEAFGGDPDNITIMGQSAGAMSVQQHCLSPISRGMFHKAVMCSGGGITKMLSATSPEKHYDFWHMIMEKLGCKTLDEFKKAPVEQLFAAWTELRNQDMSATSPCIDGELIIGKGYDILTAGEHHNIPYMIGTTSEDMMPPILYGMADQWCAAQKSPAYLWYFERSLPGDDHGAWHSADLWYWFGTLDRCWRPFTDKDRELSSEMVDRLVAFAKTGSPNAETLTEWTAGGGKALVLGNNETKMAKPSKLKMWVTMFTNKAPGE